MNNDERTRSLFRVRTAVTASKKRSVEFGNRTFYLLRDELGPASFSHCPVQ
jgi:hypothetical protein